MQTETSRTRGTRGKARSSRGALHDLLTRALPDFVDKRSGVCDLHKLANHFDMTPQGVYKWMRPNRPARIPYAHARAVVKLSKEQATADIDFDPVTLEDFGEFLS